MDSHEDLEREKQKFIDYLDQYGVNNKIEEVLLMMYNKPEQPSDPINYVRKNIMGADNSDDKEIIEMKSLIESAAVKIAELASTQDELRVKLEQSEDEGHLEEGGED